MASKGEMILRAAAALFGGIGAGLVQGAATGFGGIGTGVASRVLGGAAPGTVAGYPDRISPFHYAVNFIETDPKNYKPNFNAAYKSNPVPTFMRMQTLDEHNGALNKYLRKGMGPLQRAEAIKRGQEEEKRLDSFWIDDDKPRSDDAQSSSTAVSGVHINPDGTVSVQFRNKGKWYTYSGGPTSYEAAMSAHDLVTADSMGQAINKKKGWWAKRHKIW